jgi:hypothetical protein
MNALNSTLQLLGCLGKSTLLSRAAVVGSAGYSAGLLFSKYPFAITPTVIEYEG